MTGEEWAWVATPLVAIAGLAGVVTQAIMNSRLGLRRLKFESSEADRTRDREARSAVRASVEHIAEVMLDAREFSNYTDEDDYFGPPFDFGEEWPDWFAKRKRRLEHAVARIREDDPRLILEMVVQVLEFANGISRVSTVYGAADEVVRDATNLGFEVSTAWLREQEAPDVYQALFNRLRGAFEEMAAELTPRPDLADAD